MTLGIGSGQREFLMAQRNQLFHLSTWNLYLRDITFVTDVSIPTIETIKLVFKPVFLKQFHFLKTFGYLYDAFEIGEKGNIEGREQGCRQSLYRGTKNFGQRTPGRRPTRGFSLHSTKNI